MGALFTEVLAGSGRDQAPATSKPGAHAHTACAYVERLGMASAQAAARHKTHHRRCQATPTHPPTWHDVQVHAVPRARCHLPCLCRQQLGLQQLGCSPCLALTQQGSRLLHVVFWAGERGLIPHHGIPTACRVPPRKTLNDRKNAMSKSTHNDGQQKRRRARAASPHSSSLPPPSSSSPPPRTRPRPPPLRGCFLAAAAAAASSRRPRLVPLYFARPMEATSCLGM